MWGGVRCGTNVCEARGSLIMGAEENKILLCDSDVVKHVVG